MFIPKIFEISESQIASRAALEPKQDAVVNPDATLRLAKQAVYIAG
jgi:hypothetical protein